LQRPAWPRFRSRAPLCVALSRRDRRRAITTTAASDRHRLGSERDHDASAAKDSNMSRRGPTVARIRISRTRPTAVAAMKFRRNSDPIVGMTREMRDRVLREVHTRYDQQGDGADRSRATQPGEARAATR
jgi:hypothetical protein